MKRVSLFPVGRFSFAKTLRVAHICAQDLIRSPPSRLLRFVRIRKYSDLDYYPTSSQPPPVDHFGLDCLCWSIISEGGEEWGAHLLIIAHGGLTSALDYTYIRDYRLLLRLGSPE